MPDTQVLRACGYFPNDLRIIYRDEKPIETQWAGDRGQILGMLHASALAMHTVEIPRRQWSNRLDEFSRVHEGWPVSLDILAESIGAQSEFRLLSLTGITAEPSNGGTISITVTLPAGGFFTHTIHLPVHVFVEETDAGADAALEIESADGTKAILQFRIAPAVKGLVRGRVGEPIEALNARHGSNQSRGLPRRVRRVTRIQRRPHGL